MELLYNKDGNSVDENGYIDMLKDLKKHSFMSMKFATKSFSPPKYSHCKQRHSTDVWKDVLKSDRVHWIVRQISRKEGKSEEETFKEAEVILKELAYTDHMSILRTFAFLLIQIQSSIYQDGVFVNVQEVENIREMVKHHPIVFMPSHRSYMDFLMMSLVCFYLDLPLPAIAAGMDFMSMKVIGSMLRASGAFFMRRSFGSDQMYWALFTEYVHTILINGDRPMEFFIEGTRSRVGKSLNPKFGLLSVISEPYLKAQTYDVVIVPVSISYDRMLEERLYAYELLGVPKPKESTSGLYKASSILQDNYGSVHVHFGQCLSLREYFGHLDRAVHACYPRYMLRLSSQEEKHMKLLGYKILQKQQENAMCSLWSVVALVLSTHPAGISLHHLISEVQWIKSIAVKLNFRIYWPPGTLKETVQKCLFQFKHIVSTQTNYQVPNSIDWVSVLQQKSKKKINNKLQMLDPVIQENAAQYIMIANYRNQLLHYLIRPALLAFVLHKHSIPGEINTFTKDLCLEDFTFLSKLLRKDFIFVPDKSKEDLEEAILFFSEMVVLSSDGTTYTLAGHSHRVLRFLRTVINPFLIAYWLTSQFLISSEAPLYLPKCYGQVQQWIAAHLDTEGVEPEMLSLNLLSNAVHGLEGLGGVVINKLKHDVIIQLETTDDEEDDDVTKHSGKDQMAHVRFAWEDKTNEKHEKVVRPSTIATAAEFPTTGGARSHMKSEPADIPTNHTFQKAACPQRHQRTE
uniref:dihydroxyacetone phosphate acyltransferase-like isoform X2 n=1 Tax=Ciona intestinalis TaxID=7719 RepID=UPI000EF5416F|nr:dihydroxyacetone phosphate acyltransferase-like isoform X2 [Ciona intestinalis]|eukprot:XP_026695898.1 dihydroxyacetone phosphate acyltransferase-like isoform X2 [Ciona intestinalis]